jgi:hypothetical protein
VKSNLKQEATSERHPTAGKLPLSKGQLLSIILVSLAVLYLLLLIPDPAPAIPRGAGKPVFLWKLDTFWSELEKQFVKARAEGCQNISERSKQALAESGRLLDDLALKPLAPEHSSFVALETNLFQLAPLVGACPQHLQEYIQLVTRTRAELKKQSIHWDLGSVPVRQRIYRLLFGTRMALEEAMLQAPGNIDLPQTILGSDEPSQTPSVKILGVILHSGDILVSRGGAPTSALIARGNDYPGNFSHVALLHVDEKTGQASLIESHIESGVSVTPLDKYLADKKLRIMVLRPRADLPQLVANPMLPHLAAAGALREAASRHIPYDFAMDHHDHQAQFCSEVVAAAYEQSGIQLWKATTVISSPTVTAWLGSVGVRFFETQEPADLEYDPQLTVVAEWRDRSTLFKAHVDDAVTDIMLEEAKPGQLLDHQSWMLPASRLAKAYSCILNLFGKAGPVPEGMSATTALRVKKYRAEHDAIAARVLTLSGKFQAEHGYTPPFWQLAILAKQAKAGIN